MRSQGKALFVVLVVLLLLGFVGIVIGLLLMDREPARSVAGNTVLEIDLSGGIADHVRADPWSRSFWDTGLDLREAVEALNRASTDPSIKGLVARVGAAPMGLATIQELRDAVIAFAAAGKQTFAYADTLGEFGPGNGAYYLASAFDTILLQPSGDVGLTGLLYQTSFLKGTLDKLDMVPRFDRRHEYKNAVNSYTEEAYTAEHEEAMQALVDSQFDHMLGGIAGAREMTPDEVRGLFDRGPYYGQEAVDLGLVDALAYRDEVYDRVKESFEGGAGFETLGRYHGRQSFGGGKTVALIYGIGAVVRGESDYDAFSGSATMGSETVAEAFRDAVDDPDVEAILFRINSPGGSYVGSDSIWHETVRAAEAGKPVIVSMGNLAASGGYFVAMSADKIIAQPGTITGSIGVYAGKLLNRGFWRKLGISFDDVGSSANARIWSTLDDFDEAEWERFQASLDRIYDDFVGKVAEGRELPVDRVREIAKGRIWTGTAALENGLVDGLGGFPAALSAVREVLDLDEDARLELEPFPKPKTPFELFFEQFPMVGASEPLTQAIEELQPLVRTLRDAGLMDPGYGPLSLPWNSEIR